MLMLLARQVVSLNIQTSLGGLPNWSSGVDSAFDVFVSNIR